MTQTETAPVKARRGDLVLVQYVRDYGSRAPEWHFELVTSVTRDGAVKATVHSSLGRDMKSPLFWNRMVRGEKRRVFRCYYRSHLLLLARKVDVAALWAAWLARQGDSWQPEPFRSVEEARDFAEPFRRTEPAEVNR